MAEPVASTLRPLCCDHCNAPIPLGEDEYALCPYCGARVLVPAEYAEMRTAQHRLAAERPQMESLMRRFGTPPSLLAFMFAQLNGCLIPVIYLFTFGMVTVKVVSAVMVPYHFLYERVLHQNSQDLSSPWVICFLVVLPMFAWLAVPVLALVHMRLRLNLLRILQSGLAAAPPIRDGGPASCRRCNAPLDIPPDAIGVLCTYCGSENLVGLPQEWVRAERRQAESVHSTLVQATDEFKRRMWEIDLKLALMLIPFGLLFLFMGVTTATSFQNDFPPPWRHAMSGMRVMRGSSGPLPLGHAFEANGHNVYFVPLRYHESLTVHAHGYPQPLAIRFLYARDPMDLSKPLLLRSDSADDSYAATFQAPLSAWYRTEVDSPPTNAAAKATIEFEVERN